MLALLARLHLQGLPSNQLSLRTMDFEHYGGPSAADQPKQRRRRRNAGRRLLRNKGPLSARLTLDPQLRGNVGIVSDDLVSDLFQRRDLTGKCGTGDDCNSSVVQLIVGT